MLGLTTFDFILLFILGCSVIIGVKRGFIRELFSLVSWVVAFFVAITYAKVLAPLLPAALTHELVRWIISFIVLLILVRVVMMLLVGVVDALLGLGGLAGFNRMLGSLFGLARGALLVLILVLIGGLTAIPQEPFWKNARFSPYAEQAAMKVVPYLPQEIAKNIRY